MTSAQPLRPCLPQSTIIAAFWWPYSRADIACMLRTTPGHLQHAWLKAKEQGRLPRINRPAKGFNLQRLFLARVSAGRAA
jgi:hypothetical protein